LKILSRGLLGDILRRLLLQFVLQGGLIQNHRFWLFNGLMFDLVEELVLKLSRLLNWLST
jgi:hypothetical protein